MNLNAVTDLERLEAFASQMREGVTASGYRYVYLENSQETLPIDALASKTLELVRNNYQYMFDEAQRNRGRRLVTLIDNLYKDNDNRVLQESLFTQMACLVRGLWDKVFNSPGIRYQWDSGGCKFVFECYTKEQFIQAFSWNPSDQSDRSSRLRKWRDFFGEKAPLMWRGSTAPVNLNSNPLRVRAASL